jgi:hypothetical protein
MGQEHLRSGYRYKRTSGQRWELDSFRMARQSAGTSQSRTCGQYRLSPGVEAVLAAQFCDVRFGTQPPGKSRFVAIGRQLSYPLKF